MSGVIVLVAYRPKPGKEKELLDVVRSRVPTLRMEGLVTDRAPIMMRARDGTIIEVSEWKLRVAIDAAHKNPTYLRCGRSSSQSVIAFRSERSRKRKKCSPISSRSDCACVSNGRETF